MLIPIKPELQQLVEEQVRAGHFASAEDMVEEAMARLLLDREVDEETLKAIEEGEAQLDRGECRSFEEFAARFREQLVCRRGR